MKYIIPALALALAACSPPSTEKTETPPAPATDSSTAAANTPSDLAQLSSPTANAAVTSPLHVTGIAPANWYFENQFPVKLVDTQGNVIAQAPATPRVNWTENAEPKEFDATLTFTATGPATLVLQEDMPRDDVPAREIRVPVTLAR
jgi:hypothetical protein